MKNKKHLNDICLLFFCLCFSYLSYELVFFFYRESFLYKRISLSINELIII